MNPAEIFAMKRARHFRADLIALLKGFKPHWYLSSEEKREQCRIVQVAVKAIRDDGRKKT